MLTQRATYLVDRAGWPVLQAAESSGGKLKSSSPRSGKGTVSVVYRQTDFIRQYPMSYTHLPRIKPAQDARAKAIAAKIADYRGGSLSLTTKGTPGGGRAAGATVATEGA